MDGFSDQSPKTQVSREDIVRELAGLGLERGDCVVVHSSLSSMGHVIGGSDTVIDAFLEAIGEEGTLIMPAFSFDWDKEKDVMIRLPFDRDRSPSRMGQTTETFRNREGVLRSNHPDHSWCARGPRAREILFPEQDEDGEHDIQWERLMDCGGKIVLLGVHHNRNNIMHYVEWACSSDVPYLAVMYTEGANYPTKADHAIFNGIEEHLVRHGAIRLGRIGDATVRLMKAKRLVEVSRHVLVNEDPSALLCRDPECAFCQWGRRKNADAVG